MLLSTRHDELIAKTDNLRSVTFLFIWSHVTSNLRWSIHTPHFYAANWTQKSKQADAGILVHPSLVNTDWGSRMFSLPYGPLLALTTESG
jgi:hypothetical protein